MSENMDDPDQALARRRAQYLAGLLWHTGAFVIISVFFVAIDLIGNRSLNWSFWTVAAWAFALAFHALAYLIDGSNLEERKTRQYLRSRKNG
ncbi:hypothetical protein GV827_13050 [Sulfitobacter sp. JBTF-M27]|uniref:2TM domain-containing protein n=1 Tax=Sulfitobacter sediminilitoris TaxID=2698830 RepID=A0A6P0CDB3_9RHOB|nr:2TM domain-containing protein [Sulfitobacter sediminilitoris]NEK23330.1 hypothetical protein [Sulfitobacter sediminilitoris]